MAPAPAAPPQEEAAEVRYRCPKCRREVGLMLKSALVSCSRCGRAMRRLDEKQAQQPSA